jgi:periplasmic copper chaperone A
MKKYLILMVLAFCSPMVAAEVHLRVEGAWIQAVPPGIHETAIFMVLVNPGPEPVRIVGGTTPVAKRVTPMLTTKEDGRMGMKDVSFFEVPSGGRVILRPGGDHLMVYGLKKNLQAGETVSLVLQLRPGGQVSLEVPVSRTPPQ